MRTKRKSTVVGAVMMAAGAIIAGAGVTSGSMAASDTPADSTATITMVNIDAAGDAYECVLDDVELPTLAALPVDGGGESLTVAGPDGVGVGTGVGTVAVGAIIASGGSGGAPGLPLPEGAVEVGGAGGIVTVDVGSGVGAAEGELAMPVPFALGDVRDGTEEECAAARQNVSVAPTGTITVQSSGTAVEIGTGADTDADPGADPTAP